MTRQKRPALGPTILEWVREHGTDWQGLSDATGIPRGTISSWWCRNRDAANVPEDERSVEDENALVLAARGPRSLQELLDAFAIEYRLTDDGNADPVGWLVKQFTANSWEQHSVARGFVTLWQAKAVLVPSFLSADAMEQVWREFREDAEKAAPRRAAIKRKKIAANEACLLKVAILDPHIGMLAWGRECGVPYDLDIACRDYVAAAEHLLAIGQMYPIERIAYRIGDDLFHADMPAEGGKGATTTKGTMQDLDSRLAKLFTHIRRAVVSAIDAARLIAPVDIICIPGNHDSQTVYKFGEVLNAWYRNDKEVTVHYGPSKRRYYLYGNTVFMDTHGEEFKRKRDNLVSIFATECPPEMWAAAKYREVHVGHNHVTMEKVYVGDPLETLWEARATRVRSLPGLTPEDSWHYEEGYKHTRAATAIVFKRTGGVAGLHEFVL